MDMPGVSGDRLLILSIYGAQALAAAPPQSFCYPGLNQAGIQAACKAPDGGIVCLTATGECLRLDSQGQEIKRFQAFEGKGGFTGGMTIVPNGKVLVCQQNQGKVCLFNNEGKRIWQADVSGA